MYRALKAGASGFLLKDATADQLTEAVRVIAAGDAILAPPVTRRLLERMAQDSAGDGGRRIRSVLSAREVDVLLLIARGLSNAEIADNLGLSIETIRTHVKHVYMKTGARDRAHAVIIAYESGLAGHPG